MTDRREGGPPRVRERDGGVQGESVDERVERLAVATSRLRPRPGFDQQVMLAIRAQGGAVIRAPRSLLAVRAVVSVSRGVLVAAGVMAAISVAVAVHQAHPGSEDELSAASMAGSFVSADTEVDW